MEVTFPEPRLLLPFHVQRAMLDSVMQGVESIAKLMMSLCFKMLAGSLSDAWLTSACAVSALFILLPNGPVISKVVQFHKCSLASCVHIRQLHSQCTGKVCGRG